MAANEDSDIELLVPLELEPGVYANSLFVWHSWHEFTLDFAVFRGSAPRAAAHEATYLAVARVRMPVSRMFDALLALNSDLTDYERTFGEIRRSERRGE